MSEHYTVPHNRLQGALREHIRTLEKRIRRAVEATAHDAVKPIRRRAPKAFGDLRESAHAVTQGATPKTVVDAPHAGAVEKGSPPHEPDMEALIAWVKLRGMQANRFGGRQLARMGPTTLEQASRVRGMLDDEIVHARGGAHSPADAPEIVAARIARGIRKHGTRPHWFVKESLGDISGILDRNVRKAVKK